MVMRCHYDVLGIERDADDSVLKKAYRKLALKLHPDKNLENEEQATAEFRVVQQAYDVLSDPQERAWYDKHREAILMGGMGKGGDYQDDSVDIYAYFNSSCYSGYFDDEEGFYTVYRKVFEQISDEDAVFMDSKESECELPSFGDSLSKFDEVVGPFYGYWESYCTAKSYVWHEKYDTREAPDRYTRRAMEAENKKLCEAKKKERNEEVRALVAFVKKRDKRVVAHKKFLEEKAEETARLVKEKRLQQKKDNLKLMETYEETGWSAMSNLDVHLQALENDVAQEFRDPQSDLSNSAEEEEDDGLFCVVCNKVFKTDKALANHERSKKHREAVEALRLEMLAEDEALEDLSLSDEQVNEEPDISLEQTPQKLSKKQKKKRKQQQRQLLDSDGEGEEAGPVGLEAGLGVEDSHNNTESEICDRLGDVTISPDAGHVTQENGVTREQEQTTPEKIHMVDEDVSDFVHKSANKNKKKGKKKQSETQTVHIVVSKDKLSDLVCEICKEVMPTRNKLFDHIKKTGHAVIKSANDSTINSTATTGEGKSKRGKNKKR